MVKEKLISLGKGDWEDQLDKLKNRTNPKILKKEAETKEDREKALKMFDYIVSRSKRPETPKQVSETEASNQEENVTINNMVNEEIKPTVETPKSKEAELSPEDSELQASVYEITEERKKYLKNDLEKGNKKAERSLYLFEKNPYKKTYDSLEYALKELTKNIASKKGKDREDYERAIAATKSQLETLNKAFERRVPLELPNFKFKDVVFESGKIINNENAPGILYKINKYFKKESGNYTIGDSTQKSKTEYVTLTDDSGEKKDISTKILAETVEAEEIFQIINNGAKIEIVKDGKTLVYEILPRDKDKIGFKEGGSDVVQKMTVEKMKSLLLAKGVTFRVISNNLKKISFEENKTTEKVANEDKNEDTNPNKEKLKEEIWGLAAEYKKDLARIAELKKEIQNKSENFETKEGSKNFNGIEITKDKNSAYLINENGEVEILDTKKAISGINIHLRNLYDFEGYPNSENSIIQVFEKPKVRVNEGGSVDIIQKGKIEFDSLRKGVSK